ncbi:MAG: hypothetical protein ACK5H0_04365 [Bacteroidota bacterium]|jgi:hypothetical protein
MVVVIFLYLDFVLLGMTQIDSALVGKCLQPIITLAVVEWVGKMGPVIS